MPGYFTVFLSFLWGVLDTRHKMRLLATYIEKLKMLTSGSQIFMNAKVFCIQASVQWKF